MFDKIKSFISSFGTSTRATETEMFEHTVEAFKEFGVYGVDSLIVELGKEHDEKAVADILKGLGYSSKMTPVEILNDLKRFSEKVIELQPDILKRLVHMDKYLTDKTLTVKDTAFLDVLDDLGVISSFLSDLVTAVLYATVSDSPMTHKRAIKFNKDKILFGELINSYKSNLDGILKSVDKGSDEIVADVEVGDLSANDKKINLPFNGFTGNPIYHARLLWVDLEIWRIKRLKDKKQMFEAKLIELRTLQEQGDARDITKQVEYYEQQVKETEYKIHKLSEV